MAQLKLYKRQKSTFFNNRNENRLIKKYTIYIY